MSAPVTVSVTRHVDPSRSSEMLAWVQAGTSLAEKFDGFLGSGWVRPSEDSADWHMLYRFADADSLAAWEASPQREWWLEAAQGRIEETRVERRTGIEGWFDEPATVESAQRRTARAAAVEADGHHLHGLPPAQPARPTSPPPAPISDWPLVPRVVLVTTW